MIPCAGFIPLIQTAFKQLKGQRDFDGYCVWKKNAFGLYGN